MSISEITFDNSSNVAAARFDDETKIVEVAFKGGSKYRYANFTAELFQAWKAAPSAGKWLNANVKAKPKDFPLVADGVVPSSSTDSEPSSAAAGDTSTEPSRATSPEAAMPLGKVDVRKCSAAVVAKAERYYGIYIGNSSGKAWDGRPCPLWKDLGIPVQSHWCAVALDDDAGQADETAIGIERAAAARVLNELDATREKLARLETRRVSMDQDAIDRAAAARTKMLENEVDELRGKVNALEAKRPRALDQPWKKG